MALSPAATQLWHALGMGPLWREAAAPPDPAAGGSGLGLDRLGWDELEAAAGACSACGLCAERRQAVFGAGSRSAAWLFVGEAPGAEEDATGEPFVGPSGRLLDNMLAAIGLGRAQDAPEAAYIANTVKCRPPANRNPEPGEMAACAPYLQRQIALLQPRIIVALGRFAVQALLGRDDAIGSLRGRIHALEVGGRQIPVVVTYHPSYLLRTQADKAKAWADLCLARAHADGLGLSPTAAVASSS